MQHIMPCRQLFSGTAYSISCCSMVLSKKVVLSTYNSSAGISLALYQNLICRLVVAILGFCGSAPAEKLNWRLIKVWILVNAIFVGMLLSGMYRISLLPAAVLQIFYPVQWVMHDKS